MKKNKLNYKYCIKLLESRGVTLNDIAPIVYDAQIKYMPDLKLENIVKTLKEILNKREVIHTLITGIELDILTENKSMNNKELEYILQTDEPLYGLDEILALSITNIYGSIALTNFGYFDKMKPGIIELLNNKDHNKCNTYLDDIICAIAASACSKLAHNYK